MRLLSEMKCPYCEAVVNKEPKRKTTCKQCGKPMYPRVRLSDGANVLATEQEAEVIACEWDDHYYNIVYKDMLVRYGYADPQKLKSVQDALRFKFKTHPMPRDVIWSILNKATVEAASRGDTKLLEMINRDQLEIKKDQKQ